MSTGVGPVIPQWVKDSWDELRLKYLAALRMEKAYEKFSDPATYDALYKDLIAEATNNIDGASGGAITSLEQAIQALGPVEQDGSNWLSAKTSWRKFGLITGYNMQHQKPSVLEKPDAVGKWAEFWQTKSAQSRDAAVRLIEDPVYFTNVPGSAEPGSQSEITGDDQSADSTYAAGGDDAYSRTAHEEFLRREEFAGRGDYMDSHSGGGSRRPSKTFDSFIARRSISHPGNGYWKFRDGLGTDYLNDLDWNKGQGSPGISFYNTSIRIDNFFTDSSTAADDSKTGHFLSPEIVFYAMTDTTARDLETAAKALIAQRQAQQSAIQRVDGYKADTIRIHLEINKGKWGQGPAYGQDNLTYGSDLVLYRWEKDGEFYNAPPSSATPGRYTGATPSPTWQMSCCVWPTLPIRRVDSRQIKVEDIKSEWEDLYEALVAGEGPLGDFDKYMRTQLEAEAVKQGSPGSDEYVKWMEEGIEDILDFFGAGRMDNPVPIQELGAEESGQQIALEALTREAQEKILRFRNLKPFDFQCFLVENIALLADYQDKNSTYENILRLGSGEAGAAPGTTISILNARGKQGQVKSLLNLTPAVYAALTPYIKIYRVWYDKKNGTIPISQDEMPLPNYIAKTDIDQLTGKGGGRYGGWGLQSFNWSLVGTMPAAGG